MDVIFSKQALKIKFLYFPNKLWADKIQWQIQLSNTAWGSIMNQSLKV